MPSTVVLGARGFIGGHIAQQAVERGWSVRGVRRVPEDRGRIGPASISWVEADIDHPASLSDVFAGAEVVFHAAAYYPTSGRDVPGQIAHAVRQVRHVLEAARRARVGLLVYTSSLTTIGLPPAGVGRLADERDFYVPGTLPRSAYYECKYAMECEVLRRDQPIPAVVLNPTAVFGPGDEKMGLGRLLVSIGRGWGVAWVRATTNVVDVRDVAQAHVRAAEAGAPGERYILGGTNLSVKDLMHKAACILGVRPPRFEIPLGWIEALVSVAGWLPALDQASNHLRALRHWQAYNSAKARDVLGLEARPIDDTLRDAIRWYQERGHLRPRRAMV
jgi:dihydroflavonol-4-reductase